MPIDNNMTPMDGVLNITISLIIACYLWFHDLFVMGFSIIDFSNKYEAVFKVVASIISALCGLYGAYRLNKKLK